MASLEELRKKIDDLDQILADALLERMAVAEQIAAWKRDHNLPIFDPDREKAILQDITRRYEGRNAQELLPYFAMIMKFSKELQARLLFPYHVVMIGFMGTGKSTVGRALASRLGRGFVDVDSIVEETEELSVTEIFTRRGEQAFRELEHTAIRKLVQQPLQVISCGGGAVLRRDNTELLRARGRLVLLDASLDTIVERLRRSKNRPLFNQGSALGVAELFRDRQRIYRQAADIAVVTDHKTPEQLAADIVSELIALPKAARSGSRKALPGAAEEERRR